MMCNQYGRAAPKNTGKCASDCGFRGGIQRRSRLIHNKDRGISEQSASERDSLALAHGNRRSTFPDNRVVAVRKRLNEVINRSRAGTCLNVLESRIRTAIGDILFHTRAEKIGDLFD